MNDVTHSLQNPISRINVIGTSGSGKSTFAKALAEAMGYPYIEMDALFWGPNWLWPSDDEFFGNLRVALADKPQWVLDGNYTRTIPIKWKNVDVVVWLDYSFLRTLVQAIRRAIHRCWTQDELWAGTGNRESFGRSFFSKQSIIWWTITTHAKVRQKYERCLVDPQFAHLRFVRLRNHQEAARLIQEFSLGRVLGSFERFETDLYLD